MRISCTIKELGQLIRGCENSYCSECALRNVCKDEEKGIEQYIRSDDVREEEADEP